MLKNKIEQTFCVYALVDPNALRRSVFCIGKARDNTLNQVRWRHIKSENNLRKYRTIQRIQNEGGEMKLEVLRCNLSEARAFELEKLLIATLPRVGFDLVNLTIGGEGTTGYKHTQKVCAQRSRQMKKNNPMKGTATAAKMSRIKRKAVEQLTLDEMKIAKFDSAITVENITVENELGFFRQNISSCCRHERQTAYGYRWRYARA